MKFAGKVWKLLVGIKDGLVLLFMLFFFALLYAAMTARPTLGSGDRGALLLALDGPIVEQPAQATASEVLSGGGPRQYRLRDVVHGLEAAARDDRVKAVVLDLDIFSGGGQATLSAAGEALDAVRKSGKPVLAFATAYDDDSYQLAAHASELWLDPMGGVLVTGPGGAGLYLKGLLDKLGVTANVYKAGTYKAATEPLTRTDMSPEAREALTAVYGSMWESWQQEVRRARPKAQLAP
jgi:protease-4